MDPVVVSIISSRLQFAAKEMSVIMSHTARSPIFSDAKDFVCSIFDGKARLIAQQDQLAVLLFATPFALSATCDFFKDEIYDGDVIVHNDPFGGGNHIPDWTVIRPVFHRGDLVAWLVNKAHQADTGGSTAGGYNPNSNEVFQEGLVIPPVKIFEKGKERKDTFNLLMKNIRLPLLQRGDLMAMVGSTGVGERRIREILEKYEKATFEGVTEQLLDYGESRMKSEIQKITPGVYEGIEFADSSLGNINRPIKVRAQLTVDDDHVSIDYTGSDDQVPSFINSTIANTYSCSYIALFTVVDPAVPHNEGSMRPIKIDAPKGSVVNPSWPAPSTFCTLVLAAQIIHACWRALSRAIPDRVSAPWSRTSGAVSSGIDPRTGEFYACHHFALWGGGGAFPGRDGEPAVGSAGPLGGHVCSSAEMNELAYPILTVEYELLPDSAGPGKWRGGLGVKYAFRPYPAHKMQVARFADGEDVISKGLLGAGKSIPNKSWIIRPNGKRVKLTSRLLELAPNETFCGHSQGGLGIGKATDRPKTLVEIDLRDGYISRSAALKIYGLVK